MHPRRLSLSSRAVTGLMGSHGVVIWPDGKTGFISDGRANAVVTFDPATFATTDKIPTGTEARGQSRRKQAASEETACGFKSNVCYFRRAQGIT